LNSVVFGQSIEPSGLPDISLIFQQLSVTLERLLTAGLGKAQ
jgi:hypothetical protein